MSIWRPRWWIRYRLRKCGCTLCLSNLATLEDIWAAEEQYAKALQFPPTKEQK